MHEHFEKKFELDPAIGRQQFPDLKSYVTSECGSYTSII